MNIFEHLGLPTEHRKLANKVTQFVKHWDEVTEKNKVGKRFAVQVKKDGVCALVVVVMGVISIWSRTGNEFTNTGALIGSLKKLYLSDGVYMGEMTCDSVSLEVLSGVVNTNRVNPLNADNRHVPKELEMNFFDFVTLQEFTHGATMRSYKDRHHTLSCILAVTIDYVDAAKLLDFLILDKIDDIYEFLAEQVANGEEGIVIKDFDAGWEAGHKGWRVMKLVRGVDYDLLCIDYEEGTGKYKGKVANLIFKWKGGKTIKAMLGKGWTHHMAESMFNEITFCARKQLDNKSWTHPVGKIFQVYALEESSKGKLRLPKVGEKRFDKETSDV